MRRPARNEQRNLSSYAHPRSTKQKAADHPVEEDPAVERGERIHMGKMIARGGKETGRVEGATENS